ncbi:MAG: helix-turn-helix transcriptional regulator, partial [Lachnospiraceae bacterium]|nr:helix-turn-helix transcriptional regulator [Lachnospiraceae bacterium]
MQTKRANINSSLEISRESIDHAWTMPYAHYHNNYELYILTSGERIVSIDEEEYETFAGDVALFAPNHPHRSSGNTPFSGICVHFSGDFIRQYFGESARKYLLKCFNKHVVTLAPEQLAIVEAIVNRFQPNSPFTFLALGQILEQITLALDTTKKETSLSHPYRQESKASLILDYVKENYIFIRTVEELALQFRVSEGYIFRIFRETLNTTPKDYINHLRLEHVIHRMRYS